MNTRFADLDPQIPHYLESWIRIKMKSRIRIEVKIHEL
jgi:hypothetical protein